ncbi:MaoC family dehydratase [Halorientalis marina]|jgi:acyl dehydratase|uniref:MaoC family dehydratase n=1 Tax=Halorientalis marina TaxID=2931976 RepID=UPI001FF0FB2E|nr:MaoC family dehydratase [Halorientalis marina]
MTLRDVAVGDELTPMNFTVRARNIKMMAAIMQDSTPLHFDRRYVESQGHSGLVNEGPANISYVTQFVLEQLESPVDLLSLETQLEAVVTEGDTLTATGTVEDKRTVSGRRVADLDLTLDTEEGEVALSGTATVRLADE